MKRKFFWISILAAIVVIALICLIPPVTERVAKWTGATAARVNYIAKTIVMGGLGLLLISFGVTALAAVAIVGIALIVIGVVLVAWALWPLIKSGNGKQVPISGAGLNAMSAA